MRQQGRTDWMSGGGGAFLTRMYAREALERGRARDVAYRRQPALWEVDPVPEASPARRGKRLARLGRTLIASQIGTLPPPGYTGPMPGQLSPRRPAPAGGGGKEDAVRAGTVVADDDYGTPPRRLAMQPLPQVSPEEATPRVQDLPEVRLFQSTWGVGVSPRDVYTTSSSVVSCSRPQFPTETQYRRHAADKKFHEAVAQARGIRKAQREKR